MEAVPTKKGPGIAAARKPEEKGTKPPVKPSRTNHGGQRPDATKNKNDKGIEPIYAQLDTETQTSYSALAKKYSLDQAGTKVEVMDGNPGDRINFKFTTPQGRAYKMWLDDRPSSNREGHYDDGCVIISESRNDDEGLVSSLPDDKRGQLTEHLCLANLQNGGLVSARKWGKIIELRYRSAEKTIVVSVPQDGPITSSERVSVAKENLSRILDDTFIRLKADPAFGKVVRSQDGTSISFLYSGVNCRAYSEGENIYRGINRLYWQLPLQTNDIAGEFKNGFRQIMLDQMACEATEGYKDGVSIIGFHDLSTGPLTGNIDYYSYNKEENKYYKYHYNLDRLDDRIDIPSWKSKTEIGKEVAEKFRNR